MLEHQFRGASGSENQHGRAREVAELRGGQAQGYRHDREPVPVDAGTSADRFAGREGHLPEPREDLHRFAGRAGGIERPLDLSDNLIFADDHRVEAGAHAE